MEDIYEILARHFKGKSTAEENVLVEKFKRENLKEYQSLEKLWHAKLAEVKDYDHESAWKVIQERATGKKAKVIPLYRRIASIAAAILLLASVSFFLFKINDDPSMTMVSNDTESVMPVNLPDGSMAILNRGAAITYPATFDENQRKVSMTGEVFYDVNRDTLKPFMIEAPYTEVIVLGTSFNIKSNDAETEVSVATGKVQVRSTRSNELAILEAGEKAKVADDSLIESVEENKNFASWNTGVFTFEDEPVTDVISSLNAFYNDRIVLKNLDSICSVSTTFDNMELEYVVEIISVTCNFKITETEDIYELY